MQVLKFTITKKKNHMKYISCVALFPLRWKLDDNNKYRAMTLFFSIITEFVVKKKIKKIISFFINMSLTVFFIIIFKFFHNNFIHFFFFFS